VQQELGRAQLQQIAEVAQREEAFANGTTFSQTGGDAAAAVIATRAFEQQAEVVAHLIQLQEELRQKLIASGLAASSPAVEKTLREEENLIRQLDVDWQKLQHSQMTQAQQISISYKDAFTSITADLNRGLISWMNATEKFGKAMQKVWTRWPLAAAAVAASVTSTYTTTSPGLRRARILRTWKNKWSLS
jgi:hypothetical protein